MLVTSDRDIIPVMSSLIRLQNINQKHYFNKEKQNKELDLIFIENLKGNTVIGICDDELTNPQPIEINILMGIPQSAACESDNILHTVDYDKVRTRLVNLMKTHKFKLLEAFGEEVANIVINEFNVHWTKIEIKKPKKYSDVKSVGVVIERTKYQSLDKNLQKNNNILNFIGAGHIPEKNKKEPEL